MNKKLIDTVLIIFSKYPEIGRVKTRLIPALGAQGAFELYVKMLHLLLWRFARAKVHHTMLYLQSREKQSPNTWPGLPVPRTIVVKEQCGSDLGSRMYHAIAENLSRYQKVIIIGADCPFITRQTINQASAALNHHDMVFAPASDGGYVLVGAAKAQASVFENIPWSSQMVMSVTEQRLRAAGLNYCLLTEMDDIDTEADLHKLKNIKWPEKHEQDS